MTEIEKSYTRWCDRATEDPDITEELRSIAGNENEIRERFYRPLAFGTGGLRGVIGAGTNRMNVYTVRRATQGLANYLKAHYAQASVAISFDSRIKSDRFAREAARVLGYNRTQTFFKIIFPQMCKRVLPPVTNEVITLVKDTSLAFVLAYTEMFTIAKQVAAAQANILPLFVAGVFYYIFNLVVAGIMGKIENWMNYYQ